MAHQEAFERDKLINPAHTFIDSGTIVLILYPDEPDGAPLKQLDSNPPFLHGWLIWLIATIFVVYQLILQTSYAAINGSLSSELSITGTQSSLLASSFLFTYALIQLPAGLMLDRHNLKWLLSAAALICSLATLSFSLLDNYWTLVISRAFMGVSAGFAFPGAGLIARRWIRPSQFALAMGLIDLLFCGGAIIGNAGIGELLHSMSWRTITQWLAALGGVIALLIVMVIRSSPSGHAQPAMSGHISIGQSFLELIRTRQVWLGMVFYGGICASVFGFYGLWDVPLQEAFKFSRDDALKLNSWMFIGMGIGAVISGLIADWWGRRKPLMVVGSIGSTLAIAVVIFTPVESYTSTVIQLFVNGLLLGTGVLVFPAVCESLPRGYSGAAIGSVNAVGIMSGALLQFIPGLFVSSDTSSTLHTYQQTLVVFLIAMFLATLAALKMHETRPGWDNAVTDDNENLDPHPNSPPTTG